MSCRDETCDAHIIFGKDAESVRALAGRGKPCLVFSMTEQSVRTTYGLVRTGSYPWLHSALRNIALFDNGIHELGACLPMAGDEIVATIDGQPFWIRRRVGSSFLHLVASALPESLSREPLRNHFCARSWLKTVPLLEFTRTACRTIDWEPPRFRACAMIDDPNLHARSYGWNSFDRLLVECKRIGLHVAFATVPLDTWFFSRSVAPLFRENRRFFSLLMHGSNHRDVS